MDSRVDKYYGDVDTISTTQTRSSRNARLYRQVYDEHGDLENLPLADNTNEIDMDKLKKLISEMNVKEEESGHTYSYDDLNILEKKKRNIDENKVYDINKLLEKARYENEKLKEPENDMLKTSKNILSKLDNTLDLNLRSDYTDNKDNIESSKDNELDMTREMKYHTKQISTDPLIEQVMPDNDLAMDLFFDLKPIGDTVVTKPVRNTEIEPVKEITKNPFDTNDNKELSKDIFNTNKMKKPDIDNLVDTSDIDVIKNNKIDEDFFTSSYKFSDRDFNDDDEFFEDSNAGNIIKILLLILVILVFAGVIVYFVLNYGLGVK